MQLDANRLILRAPVDEDAGLYFKIWNDPYDLKYNNMRPPTQDEALQAVRREAQSGKRFTIVEKSSQTAVGFVNLEEDSLRFGVKSLGLDYCMDQAFAGKGYMTEALYRILEYCFDDLGLELVSVRVFAENLGSLRVLEKLGFVREGVLRHAVKAYGGVVYDDMLFSIFHDEFEGLRKQECR